MRLGPKLMSKLEKIANDFNDDTFFAVRNNNAYFVTNWVFGIQICSKNMNENILINLRNRAAEISKINNKYQDILLHVHDRGWEDILIGKGVCQDVKLVRTKPNEISPLKKRGWDIMTFVSSSGRRYYIREPYFDVAEELIDGIKPVIFRPRSKAYPPDYRPMLFLDKHGSTQGILYTITENNLHNPINIEDEYKKYIEMSIPEIFS